VQATTRTAAIAAAALLLGAACGSSRSQDKEETDRGDREDADRQESPGGVPGLGMMGALMSSSRPGQPGPYDEPNQSPGYARGAEHVAVVELRGSVVELPSFSLFGGIGGVELRRLTDELGKMAADPEVTGLLLRVGDLSADLPAATELRQALLSFRSSGGRERLVACHFEAAGNASYHVLTACDRIGVAPLGDLFITGPVAVPVHLKGLLDKLRVSADFLQVGSYKGAAEPLTRDRPSREMVATLDAILDAAHATIVAAIAEGRGVTPERAGELVDTGLFTAEEARDAGLVDAVATFGAFRDEAVGEAPWKKRDIVEAAVPQDLSKLLELVGAVPRRRPTHSRVALVYALGAVVDGKRRGVAGARDEISSQTLSAALRALGRDDSVKAIVIRVDSGGGSARASEIIWQAVTEVKEQKPVVVSMGSVAGSGGYYIAAGATKIYADRNTLTGSIGVVGGKLVIGRGMAELGIRTYPMGRGKRALFFSSFDPWTQEERETMRQMMEDIYGRFVARVAESRGKTREEVLAVAEGRVWTGEAAVDLGLVDALGGLEDAVAEARRLGEVAGDAELEVYPPEPTLFDILQGFSEGGLSVTVPAGADAILAEVERTLGDEAARVARSTLEELMRFRTDPVRSVVFLPALIR
jgi:protease IV